MPRPRSRAQVLGPDLGPRPRPGPTRRRREVLELAHDVLIVRRAAVGHEDVVDVLKQFDVNTQFRRVYPRGLGWAERLQQMRANPIDPPAFDQNRAVKNEKINIIYLDKNIGKKKALAKAMQKATGSIFAFTDSDSIWKNDSIEKIVTIFENNQNIGAVSGHCNAKNAKQNIWTRIQDQLYEKQYRWRKGFESNYGAVSCVSGPLACYRREAIYNYIPKWENDEFLGKEFRFATDRIMTGFALCGKDLGTNIKEKYSESSFIKDEKYEIRNWDVVYLR